MAIEDGGAVKPKPDRPDLLDPSQITIRVKEGKRPKTLRDVGVKVRLKVTPTLSLIAPSLDPSYHPPRPRPRHKFTPSSPPQTEIWT